MENLPLYKPSDDMLRAFDMNFKGNTLKDKLGEYFHTRQLSYDNVCTVLQTLLSIEDMAQMELYSQLMETNVAVQRENERHYAINLSQLNVNFEAILEPELDEIVLVPRASLLASPLPRPLILAQMPHIHESLKLADPMHRSVGNIAKVESTKVTFTLLSETKLNQKYTVIFRSNRFPFRLKYHGLEQLDYLRSVRRYLFPVLNNGEQPQNTAELAALELVNTDIANNVEQLQAVGQIVAGPSTVAPYIIFGPPGTGKTTTVVEAILQLYLQTNKRRKQGSHIIVTAGSNSACDTIALKILACIGQDSRFPKSTHQSKKDVLLRLYSKRRYRKGLKTVHPLVLAYSNCPNGETLVSLTDLNLNNFGIIVATLCMVGVLALRFDDTYTHVFIDEAAASTEPETLLGIVGIKDSDCHIILSGDHKQLGPVVISQRALDLGLGQSLMERLMANKLYEVDASGNYDPRLQTRLRRNYRSHPEIVGIYNKLYYNEELITSAPMFKVNLAANWRLLSNKQFPILFHAVYGTAQHMPNSTSSYNQQEAEVLSWYVRILLRQGIGAGQKVHQQDIGVISPYLDQCRLIKQLLDASGLTDVDVGTVTTYQGREKPIIVASLVTNTSFVTNSKRVNVLLSRAMSLMILVGHPVCLGSNRDFQYVIDQCQLHGNVLGKKKKSKPRSALATQMENLSLNNAEISVVN